MKRVFQIEEQTVEDPSTKLRVEFSSVHTDELNAGRDAPVHDDVVVLRVWTSDRTRLARFLFTRQGRFIRSEIEPVEAAAQAAGEGLGIRPPF